MGGSFNLFPVQASTFASRVDNLYFFMLAVTVFFSVLVAALIVVLAVRYQRRRADEVGANIHGSTALEIIWTAIPLLITLVMFVWGTSVYFALAKPPAESMEIYVVGKRWMWKAHHLTGHREINQLHIPVGTPVKLLISSEDVIHSYYIPAFRTKMDAVPGKTTTLWFEANQAGEYRLFCAEYCGTQHSGMIGKIVAMAPRDYQQWLAGGAPAGTLTSTGAQQFASLGCVTCHQGEGNGRGPSLVGVFGKPQSMANGARVLADEAYLRESILNPQAKMVQGYPPLMPTYQGQISEEGLVSLIAYIKSLGAGAPGGAQGGSATPAATPATDTRGTN
ncbi:MAG: cytochrome c oxidase subunit II [Luteitalea sp.]